MLPPTQFAKRGRMLYAVIDGRIYPAGNSEMVRDDYVQFLDKRFPLVPGSRLESEEREYRRTNAKAIDEEKVVLAKTVGKQTVDALKATISRQEDVMTFLYRICLQHKASDVVLEAPAIVAAQTAPSIVGPVLRSVLPDDYLFVNRRVYPLEECDVPLFMRIRGRGYTLKPSLMTVEDVEARFQGMLREQLASQVNSESSEVSALEGKLLGLQEACDKAIAALGVVKTPHLLEFGEIGMDLRNSWVYWLCGQHHNSTTSANYAYGMSAAAVPLQNKTFTSRPVFIVRDDSNSGFRPSGRSLCIKMDMALSPLETGMYTVRQVAEHITRKGTFHE